jgi:hypothetical protein
VLPRDSKLGHLTIVEVFEFYDGPKLFSARNRTGTLYLVFWADQDEEADHWFYVPVSEGRLESVKEGDLSLREAITQPEDGLIYQASVSRQSARAPIVREISPGEIDESCLPPEGDAIEVGDTASEPEHTKIVASVGAYEVAIGRGKRNPPMVGDIGQVLSTWSEVFYSTLASLGQRTWGVPVASEIGSFVVTVSNAHGASAEPALTVIRDLLANALSQTKNMSEVLQASQVNFGHLAQLLSAVAESKADLEVSLVCGGGRLERMVHLKPDSARKLLHGVSEAIAGPTITSDEVPQANSLETVLRLVQMTVRGEIVTPEGLGVVPRQVNYYKQAARILSFLNEDNMPTFSGQRVAIAEVNEQVRQAAEAFSISHCGWAWIRWSKVSNVFQLDGDTAVEFLLSAAAGINDTTKKRRAQTLRSWVDSFKKIEHIALNPNCP